MNIGIELNDIGYDNVNMSRPDTGNPGIGGSEYLFLQLAFYLHKFYDDYNVVLLHYNEKSQLPDGIKKVTVENQYQMLDVCENEKIDILVHQISKERAWYEYVKKKKVNLIAWAHIYPSYEECRCIKECENEKRIVFVGKEEYDYYLDDDIIEKSACIYNMMDFGGEHKCRSHNYKKTVTYMGSLVPAKGFHELAKVWPRIVKKVPDAELNVIGTGRVYDRNQEMGKYGIASKEYEESFMPYLTNSDGKIMDSVHFLGIVGTEKEDIFVQSAVGVVNPTAVGETFCLSAIEMELCGVPVVSRKLHGLMDTIRHNQTGLLFENEKQFIEYIVYLLKNKDKNFELSTQATEFVKENFDAKKIMSKWDDLLKKVYRNEKEVFDKPVKNFRNDKKNIKIIIRFLRFILHMRFVPSTMELREKIRNRRNANKR